MQKFKITFFIAAVYFLVAVAGLALTSINNTSSPIWPATGLAIAMLYYFGTKYWPGIFIGAFFANIMTSVPFYVAAVICLGNALEACVGVVILVLVKNWRDRQHEKDGEILGVVTASFLSAVISSTIGTLALVASQVIPISEAQLTWVTWWSGDVVGGIVAFPVVMFVLRNKLMVTWRQACNLTVVGLVAFIIGLFVFGYKVGEPYAFLVFLGLLLALYVSGELGLYFAFLVVSVTSVLFTLIGYGPFIVDSTNNSLMALQLFLGSLGITAFVLAEFQKFVPLKFLARPLIIGWLISGVIFHAYYQQHIVRDQMRLRSLAREYKSKIENQFQLHRRTLRASSGIFTAQDHVSQREWKIFTDTLDIKLRFKAMLGIGFIRSVPRKDLPQYIRRQQQSTPNFEIKNVQNLTTGSERIKSDTAYIIEYLEPAVLKPAIGLDLSTEKFRFDAANIARDSGQTSMSRNISLKINKNRGSGFLLFVPVYKFDVPISTVEERRKALKGWMYAPLIMQDLVATAMEDNTKPELDYEIYLKTDENRKLLLATSSGYFSNNLRHNIVINEAVISKQTFIFHWRPNSNFISSRDFTLAYIGAMGVLLSLATAWMLVGSQTFMVRAEAIARQQTKEISDRNHLWQALMEAIPVGVLRTNKEGVWLFSNPTWENLMGRAKNREEFRVKAIPRVHPEDRESFIQGWQNFDKKPSGVHKGTFRILSDDGQYKALQVIVTRILDDDNMNMGTVAVAIDETEQKAQAQLLEQERARLVETAKMASLGEMAGGMAHEINNPLTIILARTEQLRRMQFESLTRDAIAEQTEKIDKMAHRISKIVKSLRVFSRNAENDSFSPHKINTIIDDTLSLCGEKLKQNRIELKLDIDQDVAIDCRPSEISQVLLNLIMNAFDAILEQRQPWISISTEINNKILVIRITDSGTGISPQIADKIMTPFFTTKEVGKGTGLGLSISKGIVELHGGHLRLDRQNSNTSFVVELPLKA